MTIASTQSQTADLPNPEDAPELHDTLGVDVTQPDAHTDADADDAIAAIERPKKVDPDSADWHEGRLPQPGLPGFGEQKESCGEPMPHFCAGCGSTTTIGDTCDRMTCSHCVESAIRNRTTEVCKRLGALRAMLDVRRDAHQKYHHVVISPPQEWLLLATKVYETTVDVIKTLWTVMGLVGWYAYHPYAGADGDDRGAWKQRINSDRDWADVRAELIHRPHFHGIAICDKVPGGDFTRTVEAETGWIIARITPKTAYHDDDDLHEADVDLPKGANVSIYGDDELARAVSYIISHTGLEEKETPNGVEHHLMANYIGSVWDFEDQTMKWWPEVVNTDEEQHNRMDAIVRAAAPTTLGVAAEKVMCQTVRVEGPEPDYETVDVVASAARSQGATADPLYLSSEHRTSSGTVSAASVDAVDTDLPEDLKSAVDGSGADQEPEPDQCRGRLLHIASAHHYLENSEWLEAAPDAGVLLTKYELWTEENPDILDNVDTDQVIMRAENDLGVG